MRHHPANGNVRQRNTEPRAPKLGPGCRPAAAVAVVPPTPARSAPESRPQATRGQRASPSIRGFVGVFLLAPVCGGSPSTVGGVPPITTLLELSRSAARLFSLYAAFWNSGASGVVVASRRTSSFIVQGNGGGFPYTCHFGNSGERAANVLGARVASCWLMGRCQ